MLDRSLKTCLCGHVSLSVYVYTMCVKPCALIVANYLRCKLKPISLHMHAQVDSNR